jgi:hypothetical protein
MNRGRVAKALLGLERERVIMRLVDAPLKRLFLLGVAFQRQVLVDVLYDRLLVGRLPRDVTRRQEGEG